MLIDCDVHPQLRRGETLADYVPAAFRDRFVDGSGGAYGGSGASYPAPNAGMRLDAVSPGGEPSGSDPEMFEKQLFGEAGVDVAVHLCDVGGNSLDPDMDAAIKRGMNEWTSRKWLGEYNRHGRYRAAINISTLDARLAVAEIEHWAGHPYYVEVLGNPKAPAPFGSRRFHPIWEAAARHGLPFSIHKNSPGLPALQTPVGFCSYYPEIHSVSEPTVYVAHLLSFITEGVFDRYPEFKVVFVEGGFAWIGPVIWRLEKIWDHARRQFPHVKRSPAEYVYDHVRFTSQPIEEPARRRDLVRLFDMIDAERILMFASDYPHWDYDDPQRALSRLSDGARRRIAYQNACELYGIPASEAEALPS